MSRCVCSCLHVFFLQSPCLVNVRNGTGSHSFGEHIYHILSGRVDELEKRTLTSCRNQIFHCIHQETPKFQGMLDSNSPEALFKAADSLVDYKASKLRLKFNVQMSMGVGIINTNAKCWQVCCSVASQVSRSQERCCDGNVTLGHRAGIGWWLHWWPAIRDQSCTGEAQATPIQRR